VGTDIVGNHYYTASYWICKFEGAQFKFLLWNGETNRQTDK